MSGIIAIDCDGILLNWHKGFTDWVKDTYGWSLDPDHPKDTYDMQDWFSPNNGKRMNKEDFVTLVKEFNSFPRCLTPLSKVKVALNSLKRLGYELVVVTSFGSCPHNCDFRKDYLNIMFDGIFSDIIILGLGECKKDTLEELQPVAFIDDHLGHAEKAVDLGIQTFVISYPFNQGGDGVIYVDGWEDIERWFHEKHEFISNEFEEEYFVSLASNQ